jgi:L-ribulose-5-phosphate 3-epimerase
MDLVMFSKMLGEFSVVEAARRIKRLGFAGVDLTVRPGGHVAPERVAKDLPEAVKAIRGDTAGEARLLDGLQGRPL